MLLLLLVLFLSVKSAAEDAIIIATGEDAQGRSRKTGEILDYTGKELLFRTSVGTRTAIPSRRIVRIETKWTPEQVEGDRFFAQHDFDAALAKYHAAGPLDKRVWVRRRLLAKSVWCFRALGEFQRAGDTFLLVVQSDPATQYFDSIPLAWRPTQPSLALEQRAAQWMADKRPVAQLMGASWLLSTARGAATAALRELTYHRDPKIAALAEAQIWRTEIVTVKESELESWQRRIDKMPASLQAGPYFVLGRALSRQGQSEQASLAYLRIPILFPRHRALAAESLLVAGRELEKIERVGEANILYRETVEHYPESPFATEAKQRIGS